MASDCDGKCVCGHGIRLHKGGRDGLRCMDDGCGCGRYAPRLPADASVPFDHDARTCSLCVMYGQAGRPVRVVRRDYGASGGPDGRKCVRDGHRIKVVVGPYRAEHVCPYCDYRKSVRRHPERCRCEDSWESMPPTGISTRRCVSCWFWHDINDLTTNGDLCPGCLEYHKTESVGKVQKAPQAG